MILLYWDIGRLILVRQKREGWGAGVIDRPAQDLRDAHPDLKGFSSRNLRFMRGFAEAFTDAQIVKQLVSQLPWGHVIRLHQCVKAREIREGNIRQTIEHGWSRSLLESQIDSRAHKRHGKALTNFKATLPPAESDMAAQVFKDPYLSDFLGTANLRRERGALKGSLPSVEEFEAELNRSGRRSSRQAKVSASPAPSRSSDTGAVHRRSRPRHPRRHSRRPG